MTIEERAKEYASKQAIQSYSYCGYLHGATDQDPISRAEQKKIDIEKACKWMYKHLTINCREGDCETIEEFRKAMEG